VKVRSAKLEQKARIGTFFEVKIGRFLNVLGGFSCFSCFEIGLGFWNKGNYGKLVLG
jgi:hypothetical protein